MSALGEKEITPLRNIPIRITVDDRIVVGEIIAVWPNDMVVEIAQAISGRKLRTSLHVPHFAMHRINWLATMDKELRTTALTERGRERAKSLLLELYDRCRGKGTGWGIDVLGPDGWKRLEEDDDIKEGE